MNRKSVASVQVDQEASVQTNLHQVTVLQEFKQLQEMLELFGKEIKAQRQLSESIQLQSSHEMGQLMDNMFQEYLRDFQMQFQKMIESQKQRYQRTVREQAELYGRIDLLNESLLKQFQNLEYSIQRQFKGTENADMVKQLSRFSSLEEQYSNKLQGSGGKVQEQLIEDNRDLTTQAYLLRQFQANKSQQQDLDSLEYKLKVDSEKQFLKEQQKSLGKFGDDNELQLERQRQISGQQEIRRESQQNIDKQLAGIAHKLQNQKYVTQMEKQSLENVQKNLQVMKKSQFGQNEYYDPIIGGEDFSSRNLETQQLSNSDSSFEEMQSKSYQLHLMDSVSGHKKRPHKKHHKKTKDSQSGKQQDEHQFRQQMLQKINEMRGFDQI